jgi:chain length determinant protein tyrosine kinase EpsG
MTIVRPDSPAPTRASAVASTPPRDRSRAIGAILVDLGRLEPGDVEMILAFASKQKLLFGDAAVVLKRLRRDDIELALARQYKYTLLPRGGPGGVADEVVAAYDPDCAGVESLRELRSQLSLGWQHAANRGVLTVISAARGEGRSWLVANLATLFAQAGYRTLLMDANLRRPHLHTLFNLDNSVGLTSLLTGRAGREIAHRIHEQLRLYVMPAGIVPPNPHELLTRPVFKVVLDQCALQFDVVLIDTPAVSEGADAKVLSARAGAALMLVRKHQTQHAQLTAAMTSITQAGVKVIGSVINEY